MAEFFMEGYIRRLLDQHDPVTRKLRREATFYCVPNMCPGEGANVKVLFSTLATHYSKLG